MRTRTSLVAATALLLAAPILLTGCGREQPAEVGVEEFAAGDREPMPMLSGPLLDGGTLDLADYRGKVVVLNNWASWCGPCREEIPVLTAFAAASDPTSVQVIGMDIDDDPAAAKAFVGELGMAYPSLVDIDGTMLAQVPGVPPAALPSTVVIDQQGEIAARIIGEVKGPELDRIVAQVTKESPAG